MRTKIVDGVELKFPETKWEGWIDGLQYKNRRKWIIKEMKTEFVDRWIDGWSALGSYLKHIGKAFMYFLKAFNRKPVEFRDYIPHKSIRLCRLKKPIETKPLPGPLDHFN